jgi:ring-1,2-phenylacetyl-CoA epoxidase subunit PaaE
LLKQHYPEVGFLLLLPLQKILDLMAKFHTLKVADITKETTDSVSIGFAIPENLQDDFKYIQGQYLTLKMDINGEDVRRSYSLCTSPVADSELRVAVKKVEGGVMSTYLNENLRIGATLDVMTPMGKFYTEVSPAQKKNYVLFAGGSGITPMLGILKTVLAVEKESTVTLLYANRNEFTVIFKKELDQLNQNNSNLDIKYIYDQAPTGHNNMYSGMVSSGKAAAIFRENDLVKSTDEIFICGPGPLMENVIEGLKSLNFEKSKTHVEYFTTVLKDIENAEKVVDDSDFEGTSAVTVILDGDEMTFDLKSDGDSILDAAIDAGMDVPFSCKGAVCCTCRAKVMTGKVNMEMNYSLEEDEVEEGFILTCQSHPRSEKITIDFDQM